ncbi:TIGR03086 family metal-binding protein [Streptomyces sp. NBC_00859]|uniref:TIGR03086 family metal-binding protein n=1 Tax=Streptomyces sp. NBC_00859 TaxID=2903682 RepID=UPI00386F23E5|nr:TIGR03086 family metal-binding protein [Streptomyces sp. NBC_00859]
MIDLKPACREWNDLLADVSDEHLTKPTPCSEYTVRDLIVHIAEAAQGFTMIARRASGGGGDTDPSPEPAAVGLGDQWHEVVAAKVRTLGGAWDAPAAWAGRTDAAGVELTNERWGRIALTEMVVHGWDLAQATDQPFSLPHETLQACFDHVAEFIPNAPVPSLWGPAVDVPAGAPLLDQLVGLTGRRP